MRPPSAVLTFLFTDIEGSTRRWEADPKAMRAALDAHDDVLTRAVESHGGQVFSHTGDGVCAAFASPRSAVDAAVAAQRALEMPVRMGIVTGEAETRGTDYSGTVLNRAARVMSSGHGGQILLDGATAGLLTGVDLTQLGPRRLRDIANPVELFQVRAAGLRTEFPPLKTLDSTPGNLKPQTTSFVGREMAVAELETAIKANHLVTLTGVGGVGKTRLALEVAARLKSCLPRWCLGDRAGTGRRSRRSVRGDGRRTRNNPTAGHEPDGQHRDSDGGQVAAVGLRQLRARARCGGGPDRDDH